MTTALLDLGVREPAAVLISQLTTYKWQLPQGSPTSVGLGNIALFRLDKRLWGLARKNGFEYTRYVDDIAVSGGSRLENFEGTVRNIVDDCGWALGNKGGMADVRSRHEFLGIVVNTKLNVDRTYIDDVRRLLSLLTKERIAFTEEQRDSLRGRIDWIAQVNPDVGEPLQRRLAEAPT